MFSLYATHPDGAGDYKAYDEAAEALLSQTPIYSGIYGEKSYLYPPLLAILLAPVISLSPGYQTNITIGFVINVLCLVIGMWLVTREIPSRRLRVALWLLPPLFAPVFMTFLHGQVTIILFTLIAGAWVSARHGHSSTAGVLLVLAAWIKICPAVILGLFLLRQDWKVLRAALIAGIGIGLFQLVVAGPDNVIDFLTKVLPELGTSGQTTIYHANVSLVGFFGRLFIPVPLVAPPLVESEVLFVASRLLTSLLLVVSVNVLVRRNRVAAVDSFDYEYALVIVAMILLTSSVTASGLVVLLLVYAVLLSAPMRRIHQRRVQLLCMVTLVLSPVDTLIATGRPAEGTLTPALALSTSFFMLLILLGVLAAILWTLPKRAARPAAMRTEIADPSAANTL